VQDLPNLSNQNNEVLTDKWKFVRNVMNNMERQKKMPLKDKTNEFNNNMTSYNYPQDFGTNISTPQS
jgi:hypothetical protein